MESLDDSNDEVSDHTPINDTDDIQKPRKRKNPFKVQQLKEEKERRQKKRSRLIIRNISFKATEEALRKHLEQWGTIEDLVVLKRDDGKLVGCAFVQYETVKQATKALLKANNQMLLGRPLFVDWALSKDEYVAKKQDKEQPKTKKAKMEPKEENEDDNKPRKKGLVKKVKRDEPIKSEDESGMDSDVDKEENKVSKDDVEDSETADEESNDDNDDDDHNDDKDDNGSSDESDNRKDLKNKLNIDAVKNEKHISNDVQEGCTVFIKNVPFDAVDADLRKVCRKYGLLWYAIINREKISGHSKGTAFVKFKKKESADLAMQAGAELTLMDEVLEVLPALSRDELQHQSKEKSEEKKNKDSRNLYLTREGLIMSGSKAAEGVSASDMAKRHKLEQVKTQVLKNLNRFVSRNRLSIHNLPLNYDNDTLKQMIISFTSFKPHECRVMRENRITPEHPKGKSKGFGFMSFNTHLEAITALRKLNNNPKIFGDQHRPIVAFSIEDRTVHKIKEKRTEKSKLNNPTYKNKLEKRKEVRRQKRAGQSKKPPINLQNDDKTKLKKRIKKLEENRAKVAGNKKPQPESFENYVGMAAKPGTMLRMRSNKKIKEQSQEHLKRVKADKRKSKQQKIKQIHLAERKQVIRPKQGRKVERDDLAPLVNKYKNMINKNANSGSVGSVAVLTPGVKKPKRTKWYKD